MRPYILYVVALSALFFSCTRLEEKTYLPEREFVFSVSAELVGIEQETEEGTELDPATKGYLGSYISASWDKGDKISVVNLTKGKVLGGSLVADRAGTITTFSGTVSGSINAGDAIALFYPSFENTEEVDFDTRQINLSSQYQDSKVPLVTYRTFTAEQTDGTFTNLNLTFSYVLSYLKINMANLPPNAQISKITLRNIPNLLSISVNETKNDFNIATDAEKSAMNKIEINGTYNTSNDGYLTVSVGVMPSKSSYDRTIVVTVDEEGDYSSPLTSAKLESHKYYNTIASKFERINLAGEQEYGVYDLENSSVIDKYDEFKSTVITGVEGAEADFTMLNPYASYFWSIKGIPSDATEGASFTAQIYSNNITNLPQSSTVENAKISIAETDGDFTKLWVKAGNTLFIIRK